MAHVPIDLPDAGYKTEILLSLREIVVNALLNSLAYVKLAQESQVSDSRDKIYHVEKLIIMLIQVKKNHSHITFDIVLI